ncbi:MAG: ABC transporter permease [Oligoflexales bacterium]|nr:ABC transporter permease [Oligoflexales bacterium]
MLESDKTMIELNGLNKTYRMGDTVFNALQDIHLKIEKGEFVAIMGPSGSGKSTLMHLLGLLDVPSSGSYKLFGQEISNLDEDRLAALRGEKIGFIFQQFNLLSRTSAEQNVGLPTIYTIGKHFSSRAIALLKQVGLGHRTQHKPNELSGGQQQRVAIARSLINAPQLILADEPTGALDSQSEKEVMGILTSLHMQGITVVIVTHEPDIAKCVKRVIRVRDGKIQSDELNPDFQPMYLPDEQAEKAPPLPAAATGLMRWLTQFLAYTSQALRSLLANKTRSALSMLGILIGVASVIAMLALGAGATKSMEDQLASLGSNLLSLRQGSSKMGGVNLGNGGTSRISLADASAIASLSDVKASTPNVQGKGQVVYQDKNWYTNITGTTTHYQQIRSAVPIFGRFFTEEETRSRARVAVIGKTVAIQLFEDKSPIGEDIKINRVMFQVIGVLPEKGASNFGDQDDVIVIPILTAMKRLLGKEYVDNVDIQASDASLTSKLETDVRTLMNMRHHIKSEQEDDAFSIRNMAEIQQALGSMSKLMSILLAAIASISLLVGGIGIMNIMLVSVAERTREIGLRKAVGASSNSVLSQFLVESIIISLLGGVFGIILGLVMALLISKFAGWTVIVTPSSIGLSAAFSAIIGVVFGLWPARTAAKLNPIDALRHE